jgi:hypothetical protein
MTQTSEITLQALVAATFVSSMFFFSLAISHAEEGTTDDTRGNAYLLTYAVKGSFGTVSNITVPGITSLDECNRLGTERTANHDQKHHPFRAGQYTCSPMSTWRIVDEEMAGDTKKTAGDTKTCVVRTICYRH